MAAGIERLSLKEMSQHQPSEEIRRLKWTVDEDIHHAIQVMETLHGSDGPTKPLFQRDGQLHPIATAAASEVPVRSLLVVHQTFQNLVDEVWELHTDYKQNPLQASDREDHRDHEDGSRTYECCDDVTLPPWPPVVKVSASDKPHVTVYDYVTAVHPWLIQHQQGVRKLQELTDHNEPMDFVKLVELSEVLVCAPSEWQSLLVASQAEDEREPTGYVPWPWHERRKYLPSREMQHLRWTLNGDNVQEAIQIIQDLQNPDGPMEPLFQGGGEGRLHPIATAPATKVPVPFIVVQHTTFEELYQLIWLLHKECEYNAEDTGFEAQYHEDGSTTISCCDNFTIPPWPTAIKVSASERPYVTIYDYVSTVHPWLMQHQESVRTLQDAWEEVEPRSFVSFASLPEVTVHSRSSWHYRVAGFQAQFDREEARKKAMVMAAVSGPGAWHRAVAAIWEAEHPRRRTDINLATMSDDDVQRLVRNGKAEVEHVYVGGPPQQPTDEEARD